MVTCGFQGHACDAVLVLCFLLFSVLLLLSIVSPTAVQDTAVSVHRISSRNQISLS